MNGTAHASYSFLAFMMACVTFLHVVPPGPVVFLALLAGIAPDLDGIYWKLARRKGASDNTFQHHLYYPTHWPVTYLPLVAWTVVAFILNLFPLHALAVTTGVYSHLAGDSISCGDGMNWGAPWGRRFVNLCSGKTDGYHGRYWAFRYRKTPFFVVENVAAVVSIIILAWLAATSPPDAGWHVTGILGLVGFMIAGLLPVDKQFAAEPPGGRYDDYRRIPAYFDKLSPKKKDLVHEWWRDHDLPRGS